MTNELIAARLGQYAEELEREGGMVYRVRAYRRAAGVIRDLECDLGELVARQGRKGLEGLPGIGPSLAYSLEMLVRTGELHTLRPVDGVREPDRLLTSLPGVGPRLAEQLENRLGIKSLEDLEQAAQAGRLAEVGIGPKRLRNLLDALAGRLHSTRVADPIRGEPTVDELLGVDAANREHVEREELPTLSPRRYNPERERWLPLFRTERAGWNYRALFSNTALAHRLGRTRDWVVIYFQDGVASGQRTVVTESRGDMRGRRVVRGRERECRAYYQEITPAHFEPEPAA